MQQQAYINATIEIRRA
ncbi:DUF3113 family protein [Staphylococcus aureus]